MRVAFVGVAVLAAASGCKRSRERECDDLAKLGTAFATELGKLGSGTKDLAQDPEIKASMAALEQECMKWPEEVFECMRANDETSPKCREAMAKVSGVVANDLEKAPAGPPVTATFALGETSWEGLGLALGVDGALAAAADDWVALVGPDGHERWRFPYKNERWIVPMPDGTLLISDRTEHTLVALDRSTGRPAWSTAIPMPAGADEYTSASHAEAAVVVGSQVFVALDDARVVRFDPAACAKKAATCVSLAFALPDESFDEPQLLAMGDQLVFAEGGENGIVRAFGQDGTVHAAIRIRDTLGAATLLGGTKVAVTMDDELVIWDLARCGTQRVILPRKRGRMYMRGEGECAECVAPPEGCLVARSPLSDVESQRPVVLADGSIAVQNMDGPARVAADGSKQWGSDLDAIGPMRPVGDALVFVSRVDETKPAKAVALDVATGKVRWQRELTGVSGDLSFSSDVYAETAGPWLVLGAKGNIAWMKIP